MDEAVASGGQAKEDADSRPVLGVVSSSLVLGESISLLDWSALLLVLLALFLVVQPEKSQSRELGWIH